MAPLAKEFLGAAPGFDDVRFPSAAEREALMKHLGFDLNADESASNLERLMEVLYSFQFVLKRSASDEMAKGTAAVDSLIEKVTAFVTRKCSEAPFSKGDPAIVDLYQAFYRKLVYRDRTLPRPWIFTTNYDLISETALDRLGMPYCNGLLRDHRAQGSIRQPTGNALAEQLDLTSRKWAAVDSFIYLCKLHGSINWIEEGRKPVSDPGGSRSCGHQGQPGHDLSNTHEAERQLRVAVLGPVPGGSKDGSSETRAFFSWLDTASVTSTSTT